jgi:hypothetical protein
MIQQQVLPRDILLKELEQAFHDLVQTLDIFDEKTFNTIPFEGSWTAGQVAEHIFKSVSGIPEVIHGATTDTQRAPDEHVQSIKDTFLNFNIKMKSPEFILPSAGPHEKKEFLEGILKVSIQMKDIAAGENLARSCTSFSFPGTGHLTRWEWLWFAVCHTKRHAHQLKNIHHKLAA